jgi:hypothetical protein
MTIIYLILLSKETPSIVTGGRRSLIILGHIIVILACSKMSLIIMTFSLNTMRINALCSDIEHNATQQNGTNHIGMHHNVADYNGITTLFNALFSNIQHNDTMQKDTDHIGMHHNVADHNEIQFEYYVY